jgi:hypothetical protein
MKLRELIFQLQSLQEMLDDLEVYVSDMRSEIEIELVEGHKPFIHIGEW